MENEEIQKLLKRTESGNNYMTSLLNEYGYSHRHPRTKELIIAQTSSISNIAQTPRVAHNRGMNQAIKSGGYIIDKATKEISGQATYRKTAQWETVWYQHGQRRK